MREHEELLLKTYLGKIDTFDYARIRLFEDKGPAENAILICDPEKDNQRRNKLMVYGNRKINFIESHTNGNEPVLGIYLC